MTDRVAVRRVFRIVNGGTPTSDETNWGGGVAWATPVDLAPVHGQRIRDTQRSLTEQGLLGSGLVPAGSLIVSTRAPIGYVAETVISTAFNQGCRGLRPLRHLDIRYFRYQFAALTSNLQSLGQGSTFQELSTEALASMRVTCPSEPAQQAIADFLDRETARIDALITAKRRMIELLEERRGEVEQTLLLDHGYETVSLRWFSRVGSGYSLPPDEFIEGAGTPVIGGNGVMGFTNRQPFITALTIAVGRVGALCGNVHVVSPPAWITDNALWVRPNSRFTVQFLAAVLKAKKLNALADKTAQPLITGETVKSLRVPCPTLEEQNLLMDRIEAKRRGVEALVTTLGCQIDLLVEHRQALITAAVTGELDVSELAA